ncbi:hypothetical protein ON010_g5569 [Phytophthora cinnamomi]|nr:hypothetical protein ON010_g5569 [Phytophthora cinnamomi]
MEDGATSPHKVAVQLCDVDVLDDDAIAGERQALAHDHTRYTNATNGLVIGHNKAVLRSIIVRDLDAGASGASARAGHAAAREDHILALVAVLLRRVQSGPHPFVVVVPSVPRKSKVWVKTTTRGTTSFRYAASWLVDFG